MKNDKLLNEISEVYNKGRLIPFLGAGLTIPFGAKGWKEIIREISSENLREESQIELIEKEFLHRNNYLEATDYIIENSSLCEEMMQEEVVKRIKKSISSKISDEKHNYKDLAELECIHYLSTNYETIIHDFFEEKIVPPTIMEKSGFNTQNIFLEENKRLWNLHGNFSDESSIVFTQKKYDELYNKIEFTEKFKLFNSAYKFIFIGFSFDDEYIRRLLEIYKKISRNVHYILLANVTKEKENELKKYGLKVISYELLEEDTHVEKIREFTNYLKNNKIPEPPRMEELEYKIPTKEEKNAHKFSLFVEKMAKEGVNERFINHCIDLFLDAELYIRNYSRTSFYSNIVDYILNKVYQTYSKVSGEKFSDFDSAEVFIKEVHKELENIKYDLSKNNIEETICKYKIEPSDSQHKGMIHVLANDEDKDISW